MRYEKTFTVSASADDALDYIADFRTLTEWEPTVLRVIQTQGNGPGEGAEYDVAMRFMGRESEMHYVCEEYVAQQSAALRASSDAFIAYDQISVVPQGKGCEVTYLADIRLTTWLGRVLEPLIAIIFGLNVRRAVRNMQRELSE